MCLLSSTDPECVSAESPSDSWVGEVGASLSLSSLSTVGSQIVSGEVKRLGVMFL